MPKYVMGWLAPLTCRVEVDRALVSEALRKSEQPCACILSYVFQARGLACHRAA